MSDTKTIIQKPSKSYYGEIDLAGYKIKCAVLDDETRILTERNVASTFVRASASYWKNKREGKTDLLPEYLAPKYLAPFITDELKEQIANPIVYELKNGKKVEGLSATILADVCDVWIRAKKAGALNEKQEEIAEKAYKILKSFAKVGIIALIDEATGFQKDRKERALAKLLSAYISEEFLPWVKTFPNTFYEELFRLKGWSYDPKSVKRPKIVGKITLKLVYGCMPREVMLRIKSKTPKDLKGNYKVKLFQSLTEEIGKRHLEKHLSGVIALMKASPNWRVFESLFNRAYGDQLELPLFPNDSGEGDDE